MITSTETQVVQPTLFTPAKERVSALGSGFVIDEQGDIVTNDHVVQGGTGIRVGFSSGASYPAKIVGGGSVHRRRGRARERARLGVASARLRRLGRRRCRRPGLRDREPVRPGPDDDGRDRQRDQAATSRRPTASTIPNAIQTDAPINHGNSGGPLLDRFGRIVGIELPDRGRHGRRATSASAFAVPSNTAKAVAKQLIATGRAEHAWLGVEVEAIDPGRR